MCNFINTHTHTHTHTLSINTPKAEVHDLRASYCSTTNYIPGIQLQEEQAPTHCTHTHTGRHRQTRSQIPRVWKTTYREAKSRHTQKRMLATSFKGGAQSTSSAGEPLQVPARPNPACQGEGRASPYDACCRAISLYRWRLPRYNHLRTLVQFLPGNDLQETHAPAAAAVAKWKQAVCGQHINTVHCTLTYFVCYFRGLTINHRVHYRAHLQAYLQHVQ